MIARNLLLAALSTLAFACSAAPATEEPDQIEDEVTEGSAAARSVFARSAVGDYLFSPTSGGTVVYDNLTLGANGRYTALARFGGRTESGTWLARSRAKTITLRPSSGLAATYYVDVDAARGTASFEAEGTAGGAGAGGTAFTMTRVDRALPQALEGSFASGPKAYRFRAPNRYEVVVDGEPVPITIEAGSYQVTFDGIGGARDVRFGLALTPDAAYSADAAARSYGAALLGNRLTMSGSDPFDGMRTP